jgi:Tol biopolymer transport system component
MGEVYRARDARLDRTVAVKVLAPELATDPTFRARFEREAKAISALTHPRICRLYDIGRDDQTEYLVLELVEGETLAARLERGPLPLRQLLGFGTEIADALEAAHGQGIVHRDLKPANVMITSGGIKLLDFGLAKNTPGAGGQALSQLATAPGTGTAQGTIIGTLQYMAPEQVQGQPADVRTDIFALGALLHEMATGRRAFEATTQASLIAKILETEPPTVSSLVPLTPPALDHVVQGCLAKVPADRWQTAHDVKMQLQWMQAQGSRVEGTASAAIFQRRLAWVPWVVAAASAALAAGLLWSRQVVTQPTRARFDLILPPQFRLSSLDDGAISPDGQRFVFSASVDGGRSQLVLRDVASTELEVIRGTQRAYRPFWSPDSRSIAFFLLAGQLGKVLLTGEPPRVLVDSAPNTYEDRGTWAPGVILFGPREGRIHRLPDTGRTASGLETLPWKPGQASFTSPRFLPDGRHFLVNMVGDPATYLASIDSPGIRKILDDALSAAYGAGHLVYSRGEALFARPFDAERLEIAGPEVLVTARAATFSVSDRGAIVYRSEAVSPSRLTWFDRSGRRVSTVGAPAPYEQLVLSPRGGRAAVVRTDVQGNSDLWDVDLATGISTRLTRHAARDDDPTWSPDERALAFTSRRTGRAAVFVKDLMSGQENPLLAFDKAAVVDQWTPDGRFVIFRTIGGPIYAIPLSGDRTPRLLADTPYSEDEVLVSADGRWVAFHSDESGVWEVYVATFPGFTSKKQVSSGGGAQPQWRADSRELFYLANDGSMMSVRVDGKNNTPVRLFTTNIAPDINTPQYAVTPDGDRFLGLEPVGGVPSFTFLLNWLDAQSR